MSRQDELFKKYRDRFVWGEKDYNDLRMFIENELDVIPVPFSLLSPAAQMEMRNGACYRAAMKKLPISPAELELECFLVKENQKSKKYYQEFIETICHEQPNSIFIILEKQSLLVSSNSFRLAKWVAINQGISTDDSENRNELFSEYLANQHLYWDNGE